MRQVNIFQKVKRKNKNEDQGVNFDKMLINKMNYWHKRISLWVYKQIDFLQAYVHNFLSPCEISVFELSAFPL